MGSEYRSDSMKFSAAWLWVAGVIVMSFAASGEAGAGQERAGWYVGGGIGVNWTSQIDQEGWNRDTYCYPDSGCEPEGRPSPDIPGYRWMYNLDLDAGAAFEISVGRMFNNWRVEFSAAQRNNAIQQQFKSIAYLDGSLTPSPADNSPRHTVTSNSMARIDDLTTRTLSVNAYYDFTDVFERITPYVGVGLGVAFVEISGLHFSTRYEDTANPARDLSEFNSSQNADLSDTVLAGNIYAGTDYSLTDQTLLGVKLTYSIMDDIEHTGSYTMHAMHQRDPAFSNQTTFSGPRQFSVMFTAKYLFGD
ncbi:MAG: outer membrane beta-barrel protein [Nitrospira sp. SB0661_bin_20]|nr:outer membrane beta-barrel protein [Nitrospira sp. SB0661_bin_20]